ncbi:MAG TPA: hypothetical protein VFC28_13790 [Opitutaceae bacterium]|nr:hypothetical protein [Opitutaceae bacterium]
MPTFLLTRFRFRSAIRHRFAAVLFCSTLTLMPILLRADPSASGARWAHIKTALFCTSKDVDQLLTRPEDRKATLAYFAPLRLSKVYLEDASGEPGDIALLREIAADLKAQGLEVSGAVVPAADHGPLCYNDPKDMATLEGRVRVLAQVFDEIIVDDWLFTTCTCAKCLADRGNDSWADYRSRLVAEQSKLHLIDVAKQVRPGIRVIIKYPNWYEGHRQHGYDVARQTPQFDGVSVGIETRQRATHDQHIPIYSGYVFQQWIGGDAGPKWRSAWLDNYEMQGADNDFVAQVWQAVLARAPEIIFWCAGGLHPPTPSAANYPHLVELMPEFDRLAGMIDGPARGISIHLPLGAVGEYNVFGYLGMIGLPMAPRTTFPADTRTAIFTQHSLRDPNLAAELLARVRAGREVFLTWPLLQDLRGSELGRALNLIGEGGTVASSTFRVREYLWNSQSVDAARSFAFPKIQLSTWPYVREVALVREDADFGVLLKTPYLEGQVDVLNLPDNSYDLLRLPEPVLNAIRRCFFEELGVRLVGPGGVALYPFGRRQYVLYNMNDGPARVALRFPAATPAQGWKDRMHDRSLIVADVEEGKGPSARRETEVALTLLPFEIALIEAP